MPTPVVPLIARRVNLGNEFGYTPRTKTPDVGTSWVACFGDEVPMRTFATRAEAYFFAAKLVHYNMDAVPSCGNDCDCGWYAQELYLNKEIAFTKAGLVVPFPADHKSHVHCCCSECPACACPVELCKHNGAHCGCLACDEDAVQDCTLSQEQNTRDFIELEQMMQREYFEQLIELWNIMWERIYDNNERDSSDSEYRITVVQQRRT